MDCTLTSQDVDLVLQRLDTGGWRLIHQVKQRWVKNNRDPKNIQYVPIPLVLASPDPGLCVLTLPSFGAVDKDHDKLLFNDAAFLLTLSIADTALFGYESLDDVRKQKIPAGEDQLVLRYKEAALDQPILCKRIKAEGVTDEPMPKSVFLAIYEKSLKNAGYLCGTSIHAIRRQLGKKVDGKNSTQ
jgi:Protein of unknown function (DUF3435)